MSFEATGRFSKITIDYLNNDPQLREFYNFRPDKNGIKEAIEQRKNFPVNRKLLVEELEKQYKDISGSETVLKNIELLKDENTFTVCTAHQPNIFTGHLYYIYKILHAIKLAEDCKKEFPEYNFVPVFFVGSEDADLDELNHFTLDGRLYKWDTQQKGAVGRMKPDKALNQLLADVKGRLLAEPFGEEVIKDLAECYTKSKNIEEGTFLFTHRLFSKYGLIVFLPDNAAFKREMHSIFEDDLFTHSAEGIVTKTSEALSAHHHAQAYPRDINLFYMKDDIRERIVENAGTYTVHNTDIRFTKEQLQKELNDHPERFSPNVILRGLLQEKVLPGIIFVGGGGELAYWLQLKDVFDHFGVAYPVLYLRNSFMVVEKKWTERIGKLGLTITDTFKNEGELFRNYVETRAQYQLSFPDERTSIQNLFLEMEDKAGKIDVTLQPHVQVLFKGIDKRLEQLEKKMVSAEKKKHEAAGRQLHQLLEALFPNGGLQERTENYILFAAKWGQSVMDALHQASPSFEAAFGVLEEG
ncbi:MAG: bacillithiol biosynthesis cysteine-adding enzyme BshC [Chitinophagaceae bacterium]|nr:bacillithiol biosynthesis cysteine-adding enzyme BshC [Chitinophagaceae bacterium]